VKFQANYVTCHTTAPDSPKTTMTELTIIIPSYNMQSGAIAAIESILSQDIITDIILVDDCSEPAIYLPDRLKKKKNITLLRTKINGGAGHARNIGVEYSKTSWISFLDSDDILLPDTLAKRLKFAKNQPCSKSKDRAMIVACGWIEPIKSSQQFRTRIPNPANTPVQFASGCWYCPGSCIIAKREIFLTHPFDTNLRRLEDYDMSIRLGLAGAELITMPLPAVKIIPGVRNNPRLISKCAKLIRTKHCPAASSHRAVWGAINAYLNLEMSSAHFRDSNFASAIIRIMVSIIYLPRLRRHFSPGWIIRYPIDANRNQIQ